MIRAIFFDLDGTLCHLSSPFWDIFFRVCNCFLIEWERDEEEIKSAWNRAVTLDEEMSAQKALEQMFLFLNLNPPQALAQISELLVKEYGKQIVPLEGVLEVLPQLAKTFSLSIVTNGPEDMQKEAINALQIGEFIDRVFVSGSKNIGKRKPHSKIFLYAIETLKISPEEVLVIGDRPAIDLIAPLEMGCYTLCLGNDPRFDSIESIFDLPLKINQFL